MLHELTKTSDFIAQQIARPENSHIFVSRLTFKAIFEVYRMAIRRQMKGSITSIDNLKQALWNTTERMAQHALGCQDLITRHSINVLRHGMTILVHG
jgi:hypothetical protein